MSVYVEPCEPAPDGLVVGRLMADSRGELWAFAYRLGMGVPRLENHGAPDEYVSLTATSWRAAVAGGALEPAGTGDAHCARTPASRQTVSDAGDALAS